LTLPLLAGGIFDTYVPLVGAESEGINQRRKGGFFTPRVETCHKILHRVQEKGVLILAGSPCSGKTSLCQLVFAEAEKSPVYESVYYINCARIGSGGATFDQIFQEQAGVAFAEASKSPSNSPDRHANRPSTSASSTPPPLKKKLLIFDEVQNLYSQGSGHSLLWPLAKEIGAKFLTGGTHQGRVNILLSASRGSNPSAAGLPSTPISFSEDQRIPLR
jgi:Cdc6-like AAA superfamily ATPase